MYVLGSYTHLLLGAINRIGDMCCAGIFKGLLVKEATSRYLIDVHLVCKWINVHLVCMWTDVQKTMKHRAATRA